jgi:hypothetical protein
MRAIVALLIVVIMIASGLAAVGLLLYQTGIFS